MPGKTEQMNKFVLFSRFGKLDLDWGEESPQHIEYKENDEAVRYDRIKKIFICGTGSRVFVDTYDNTQYVVETEGRNESERIFRKILNFPKSNELFLNLTRPGQYWSEVVAWIEQGIEENDKSYIEAQ